MGSLLPALVGFNNILYNQLLGPSKMLAFLSLASLLALSQAGVLPAGINAATCTNYPFCGPSQIAGPANVPARPVGYQAHMAAEARLIQQQQQLADINNSYY